MSMHHKWIQRIGRLAGCLAIPLVAGTLLAPRGFSQNYTLDWYTLDGGGGSSTGGVYAVKGTLGQPDAGSMSAGNYRLEGGFWNIVAALQTPGAPLLSVTRTGAGVTVSWPQPAPGWALYSTPVLTGNPVPWTLVAPPYQTNATAAFIQVPVPLGNRFYRLQKQ